MSKDYSLSLRGEAFNSLCADFDTTLRDVLAGMIETEQNTGEINIKVKITLTDDSAPDYTVAGGHQTREVTKPKFDHTVAYVIQRKEKKSGSFSGNFELVFDKASGQYFYRDIDNGQTTLFDGDGDSADFANAQYDVVDEGPRGLPAAPESSVIDGEEVAPADAEDATPDAAGEFEEETIDPAHDPSKPFGWLRQFIGETMNVTEAMGNYEEIAAYMETQEKLFCYTELDCFAAPGTVREDGEDLVQPSVGNVYFRTLGVYGRETTDQADEDIPPANRYINVAFVAKWLNYESGSETTAFKQLASVYPSKLTSTEMKALADKSLNYFITVGSKNLSMNGKVIGNEWADIIRFRDWLKNDMQLRVVNLFVTRPKVPYTDAGISLVQNQMIASLKSGQDAGGIAESEFDEDGTEIPGYVTSVPLAASLSASEKASRKLTKCKFKARLAGAIHFAELKGSLTYEL